MKKTLWAVAVLLIGLFVLQACNMGKKGDLINEILSGPGPERFSTTDVSDVVMKYIPLGINRKAAIFELEKQGFDASEIERPIEKCPDCDLLIVWGEYENYPSLFSLPLVAYGPSIKIMLGFKNEKLVSIFGTYLISEFT